MARRGGDAMAGPYVTDEEMYQAPKDGEKYERVDGGLRGAWSAPAPATSGPAATRTGRTTCASCKVGGCASAASSRHGLAVSRQRAPLAARLAETPRVVRTRPAAVRQKLEPLVAGSQADESKDSRTRTSRAHMARDRGSRPAQGDSCLHPGPGTGPHVGRNER